MKRKDRDEIRAADIKTLSKKAAELRTQISVARQTMMTKEVKNRHESKTLRQKLAVILSVLRQKQLMEKKG